MTFIEKLNELQAILQQFNLEQISAREAQRDNEELPNMNIHSVLLNTLTSVSELIASNTENEIQEKHGICILNSEQHELLNKFAGERKLLIKEANLSLVMELGGGFCMQPLQEMLGLAGSDGYCIEPNLLKAIAYPVLGRDASELDSWILQLSNNTEEIASYTQLARKIAELDEYFSQELEASMIMDSDVDNADQIIQAEALVRSAKKKRVEFSSVGDYCRMRRDEFFLHKARNNKYPENHPHRIHTIDIVYSLYGEENKIDLDKLFEYLSENITQTLVEFQQAAELGNPEALFEAGTAHFHKDIFFSKDTFTVKDEFEFDENKGITFLTKAAIEFKCKNSAIALYEYFAEHGQVNEMLHWLEISIVNGSRNMAPRYLAQIHSRGIGAVGNRLEARAAIVKQTILNVYRQACINDDVNVISAMLYHSLKPSETEVNDLIQNMAMSTEVKTKLEEIYALVQHTNSEATERKSFWDSNTA